MPPTRSERERAVIWTATFVIETTCGNFLVTQTDTNILFPVSTVRNWLVLGVVLEKLKEAVGVREIVRITWEGPTMTGEYEHAPGPGTVLTGNYLRTVREERL